VIPQMSKHNVAREVIELIAARQKARLRT